MLLISFHLAKAKYLQSVLPEEGTLIKTYVKYEDLSRTSANDPFIQEKYAESLAQIQQRVLRKNGKITEDLRKWQSSFFLDFEREPTYEDFIVNEKINDFKNQKICKKLLTEWKIFL